MKNEPNYFKNVPLEDDTTILKNEFVNVDNLPVLLQVWACDGTTACSAVIPDTFTIGMDESELVNRLRRGVKIDNSYTLKNFEHFTFINFGFCQ